MKCSVITRARAKCAFHYLCSSLPLYQHCFVSVVSCSGSGKGSKLFFQTRCITVHPRLGPIQQFWFAEPDTEPNWVVLLVCHDTLCRYVLTLCSSSSSSPFCRSMCSDLELISPPWESRCETEREKGRQREMKESRSGELFREKGGSSN